MNEHLESLFPLIVFGEASFYFLKWYGYKYIIKRGIGETESEPRESEEFLKNVRNRMFLPTPLDIGFSMKYYYKLYKEMKENE